MELQINCTQHSLSSQCSPVSIPLDYIEDGASRNFCHTFLLKCWKDITTAALLTTQSQGYLIYYTTIISYQKKCDWIHRQMQVQSCAILVYAFALYHSLLFAIVKVPVIRGRFGLTISSVGMQHWTAVAYPQISLCIRCRHAQPPNCLRSLLLQGCLLHHDLLHFFILRGCESLPQ